VRDFAGQTAPPRTEQQLAAVEQLDRDVFLRAGAGTGKTTVLVDRFCAAALDPEVGVGRILAFTFTDRAADQLRRRVRAALAARAREAEGAERGRLREAERATDRAWISTIHGFCRRLLASHPAAAGIDPRFRVIDEPEADRLASRAFDRALEELIAGGGAEALELAAANRRGTLLEMTRGAHDELRSHGRPRPELPPAPSVDASASLAELVEAARAAYEECSEASGKGLASRERIGEAMRLDPDTDPDVELLESLGALKITSGAMCFQGPGCERYQQALARARSAVAAHVLAPAYEQLRGLVGGFGGCYEGLKAERSALDFEDLQLRAVELLRGSDPQRERYREQFRHLMVDEFQDTNQLQLALIEQLRGPQTRLFMVGDEFQSIYGFRHADVEVYRRQQRRFTSGEEPNGVALPLTGNFRADPELVAATNAIGAGLLEGFEPLSSAVSEAARQPPVELLLTVEDAKAWEDPDTALPRLPDDPSSGSKVAEARLLAARLRELVDAGAQRSEIVVLLRAFTHVNTIERALAQAGLDPYVVGGRGFWSQQQIEDLGCLLAVLANPLDDQALLGALASPACGVLPDTLWLLRRAARRPAGEEEGERDQPLHLWPVVRDLAERGEPSEGDAEAAALIPGEERQRLVGFAGTVAELRRRGASGGLEALVERTASAFGYDLATLLRPDGEPRWSNVRKLMRLAREFDSREGPDLAGFIEYLDSSAARRDREAEAATRAEGHDGVRVMTVHAAKGLEFGIVAVADLGRTLRLGWTPLRVIPGEDPADGGEATRVGVQLGRLGRAGERLFDYEDLTDLAAEREAEEEARLAYVAATRAKRGLILSGTFSPRALKEENEIRRKPISLQLIRALLGGDTEERVLEVPAAGEGSPSGRMRVTVSAPAPGAGAALLAERKAEAAEAPSPAGTPPLGRPAEPPTLSGSLSYSALSEFARCGYRFYVERMLGIAPPELAESASPNGAGEQAEPGTAQRFGPGVAVHSLLEWSARHGWRMPDEDRIAAALREQGLDPDQEARRRAHELVGALLGSPLRAELEGARLSPEAPFVLSIGGALIRGSIDLLAERQDRSVAVVDYKTDRLDGRTPAEAAERYTVQRDLYALAASARGTPVESSYVFLERPEPVTARFGESELERAREGIERLLAELRAGEFEVTDRPYRALCHDCPARERLCSHGPEAHFRDSPEPSIPRESAQEVPAGAGGDGQEQLRLLER